ncbi:MAG: helix-turn-helix domain-containing protein [Lachnospiraceae bacterium]|nr:helix-turn-helix domain-containing protein [Lachnospiraceae bacterium]
MKICTFFQLLCNDHICDCDFAVPDADIYTFKPLYHNQASLKKILYLTNTEQLPVFDPNETHNILFFHRWPDVDILREKYPKSNFIFWNEEGVGALFEVFDVVSDMFLQENRYTAQLNELSTISNQGRGLRNLVENASRIIGSPINILDSHYRVIGTAGTFIWENDEDPEDHVKNGQVTYSTLERMKRDRVIERLREAPDYLLYEKPKDETRAWVNMMVFVSGGIEAAEIGIQESDHKFNYYEIELIKFFRQLVAFEIEKGNFYKNDYGLLHSIFVSELIQQRFVNEDLIHERMANLLWKEKPWYFVMTVIPAGDIPPHYQKIAEIFALNLSGLLGDTAHWTITDSSIIFLIGSDDDNIEKFREGGSIEDMLKLNNSIGVLSNPFNNLINTKIYYEQTMSLIRMRHGINANSSIWFYSDYYIYDIADALSSIRNLRDFYHPYIMLIKRYDEENNTQYFETLYEYLVNIDNPTACAYNLHVHKNTLYYRINKLKELFPIDLNNGLERLRIQLTMEFMKLDRSKETDSSADHIKPVLL